jgi:hypothetical protein
MVIVVLSSTADAVRPPDEAARAFVTVRRHIAAVHPVNPS